MQVIYRCTNLLISTICGESTSIYGAVYTFVGHDE
jgi:hypothetical protein